MEQWRDISGYEGFYQVSSMGRVKSLARMNDYKGYWKKEVILQPALKRGYPSVVLNKHKVKNQQYVHRLVATAFLTNPQNKRTVNHKDGCKSNNELVNLEWFTHQENIVHAWDIGLNTVNDHVFKPDGSSRGSKNHNSKLSEQDVIEIRTRYAGGGTRYRQLAHEYNVGTTTISRVIRKSNWAHV